MLGPGEAVLGQTPLRRRSLPRDRIIAVLDEAPGPLKADEIWALASVHRPGLSIATVYRVLKQLMADEQVRAVTLPTGTQYERCPAGGRPHDHPHFLCRQCQVAYDLPSVLFEPQSLAVPFQIDAYELTLHGLCPQCLSTPPRINI
ncbi:Fur family transcriptional regulator [Deinococcus arenicola]|uniref:Fur family transcriptional regulator n=1 Tax=Deinococcus arenicola TaxID=2994950 RepID=UPI0029556D12|nr:transcriptional repressor [Deinococcus sp. ZS9-10]